MVTVPMLGQLLFITLTTAGANASLLKLLDTCSRLFSLDPEVNIWETLENILENE